MARIKKFALEDGLVFASKLETQLDAQDVLVDIQVDNANAVATCTFDDRDGSESIPPIKKPFSFDVLNGVAFAEQLWMHTDIGNKLVWMVVHQAEGTADCWFE